MRKASYLFRFPVVLLCLGCGSADYPPNSRAIAEWAISHGGGVTPVGGKEEIRNANLLPAGAFGISQINLSGAELSQKDFQKLTEVRQLDRLSLYGTGISDEDLEYLQGIPSLRELELSSTTITDRGLEKLKTMKSLEKLYVHDTLVTSDGVKSLQQALPDCKVLTNTTK